MFISAELKFKGSNKSIKIYQFDYEFTQQVDSYGRPSGLVLGGKMNMLFPTTNDSQILEWATKPTVLKSGEIVLHEADSAKKRKIEFKNAICLYYHESFQDNDGKDQPMFTRITIHASRLIIGGDVWELMYEEPGEERMGG